MITQFKIYESRTIVKSIEDVMSTLKVEVQYPEDSVVIPVSAYDIDVIEYFKEMLLDKNITFLSVNKPEGHPYLTGKVVDVDQLAYQDEFFITVKLNTKKDNWNLINNTVNIIIDNYDADDKPLHKEIKIKKEAEKYNL